jgi:hypothetical protein
MTNPKPRPRTKTPIDEDSRPLVKKLFKNLKKKIKVLELLKSQTFAEEDRVYRFYHGSFKVYDLQERTLAIVEALQSLLPKHPLNDWFLQIVGEGTGKAFKMEHNRKWLQVTRPIVEAYFHAKYFLEQGIRFGKELEYPPTLLPSGWAAFLYLYNLR